jgi:hypothetical protein
MKKISQIEVMLSLIWAEMSTFLQGIYYTKSFLLVSLSAASLIQVFVSEWDISLLLFGGTTMAFGIMTAFGVLKHLKTGEWNPTMLLRKTVVQFVIMIGVIGLGYSASIFIFAMTKIIALLGIISGEVRPAASLYFAFVGYGVMYTYYFIKSCDLLDQTYPDIIPAWFSSPFRKFRKSGNMADLLDNDSK